MTGTHGKLLILGIGNTVMADDGVGVKIIHHLQNHYTFPDNVEILDGGTLGLDLLPKLESLDRLILVDAIETGREPGAWVRLAGEELPIALETKLSPHQMGVKDLLAVSQLMGHTPGNMVLYGIQPKSIEMDTELTPEVSAAMEPVLHTLLDELQSIGVVAVKRPVEKA